MTTEGEHFFLVDRPLELLQYKLYIIIIDQAGGQHAWILAKFSFCVFMSQDKVDVHKHTKRE